MYIAVFFVKCKFNVYSTRVKVFFIPGTVTVLGNVIKCYKNRPISFSRVCELVSFSCQKYLSSALVFLNLSYRHNFALSIIISQDDHYFDDILESLF